MSAASADPLRAGPILRPLTPISSTNVVSRNGTARTNCDPTWRAARFVFLHFLQRRRFRARFNAHGEKRAEKKQPRAPKLWRREPFAKEKRRQGERAGRTNELERLRKSDPNFPNRHV